MKKNLLLVLIMVMTGTAFGQLTGTKTIPGDYATISAAVTALNTSGVGAGGVTFNINPGHTESVTAPILITATGTATDPIVFQKSGAGTNPVVTRTDAGSNATSTLGGQGDAIIIIQGSDYITMDGIDVTATTSSIEYGYYLRKASVTNGCKYVTIRNAVVTMTKGTSAYVAGIYSSNNDAASLVSSATGITVTSTGGRNENVTISGCTVQNVFTGILLRGYNHTTSPYDFYDQNFVIGSAGAGNIIRNYGGNSASSTYGVYMIYHTNPTVSYNTIDNVAGGGTNATATLYGIFFSTSSAAGNVNYNNNTITMGISATSSVNSIYITPACTSANVNNNTFGFGTFNSTTTSYMIYCSNGTPNITVQGNTNSTFTKTGIGTLYGMYDNGSPTSGTLNFSNNNFSNITMTGASSFYGLSTTTSSTQAFTVANNTISNITGGSSSIYGLYANYGATGSTLYGNTVTNLTMASGTGVVYGINVANSSTVQCAVYGNTVSGLSTAGTGAVYGLYVGGGTSNILYKNRVFNLYSSSASGLVYGIFNSAGTLANYYNNYISDLRAPAATGSNAVIGLNISGGTTVNAFYNTIYLNASGGTTFGCSGIYKSSTTASELRNNLVVNLSTPGTTSGIVSALRWSGVYNATYFTSTSNNNSYYIGAAAANRLVFYDGTNSDQLISTYKTRVAPAESSSLSELPTFVNTATTPYDLHINPAYATLLESGGSTVSTPAITEDYDANPRYPNTGYPNDPLHPATASDIGADEFSGQRPPICTGTPAASTILGAAAVCYNTGTTLSLSTVYTDLGLTYQWKTSATAGGPYTNLGTSVMQSTGNLTATAYYICDIYCTYSGLTYTTSEKMVGINSLPVVVANPSSASYCTPGGSAVSITASGANTYTWSPAAGLNVTTGATVLATPSATTTYTVTGTDGNGCVNTATSAITVAVKPLVSASATPDNICLNGSSQLQATSFLPTLAKNYAFTAGTGATLDPMVGATQVIGTGDDDTPNATPINIGFSVNFDGASYSQFSVSPDGWLLLGNTVAASQYTNSTVSTTNIPKLYPYWDDLATGTTGNVSTLVTGSAPNRIFIVQWYVTIPRATGGAANSTFQAWLYEANGKIEFRYGTMGAGSMSASVGLSGNSPASNFNSITVSTGTNSTSTANDANAGQPASGTIYTFTPAAPTTFQWTPATFLNDPNIMNPLASGMTATTTYTATATNSGCSTSANVTVTVGSPLSAAAAANPSIPVCTGTSVTLTGTPTGGGGPYLYSWKVNGEEISTLQSFSVAPESTTTYDLTITDNCLQTSTTSVTVTVKPIPTATASSNSPICQNAALELTGTTDIGATFSWTGPNGYTSTTQNNTISAAQPSASGIYTFTASLNGCTSEASTVAVVVNYNPAALVITPSPVAIKAGTIQPLTVTGAEVPVTVLKEDFNGTVPGWTTINSSTGGTPANAAWALYLSGATFYSNDNTNFVMSNSDAQGSGSTTQTYLMTPVFSTVGYTSANLSFWHYFRWYSASDIAKVEVSTDGGATWNPTSLVTYSGASVGTATGFTNATLSMNAYLNQPTVQLRFNYHAAWGYYWAIDNVTVTGMQPASITWSPFTDLYSDAGATTAYAGEAASVVYTKPTASIVYTATATSEAGCMNSNSVTVTTCPDVPPAGVVTFVTPFSFDLSWSYLAGTLPTSYTVEVATDSEFASMVEGSPFTVAYPTAELSVEGLMGSTLYYYRIKANGACSSDFTVPGTVTTTCPPAVAPFREDFETGGFAPTCWTNSAVTGSFVWTGTTAASANGVGTAAAFANFYDQSAGSYELKTMPFDMGGLTTPVLRFNYAYATYVVEIDQLNIYYSADYGRTWNVLLLMTGGPTGTLNTAGATEDPFVPTASQWCTQEIGLPAGTNMIKFVAVSAYGNNLYLDNITVGDPVQTDLALQNLTMASNAFYQAAHDITVAGDPSFFSVPAGTGAKLLAGNSVKLLPGTTVAAGGYLHGLIYSDTYCTPPTAPKTVAGNSLTGAVEDVWFTLFPNPTNGNVTLVQKGSMTFDQVTVEVYSMQGSRVLTDRMTGEKQHEFGTANLPAGVYFVKIVAAGYAETIKLVKTR